MIDLAYTFCNVTFEGGLEPENSRNILTAAMHKGKGEIPECKNYRGIKLIDGS